jgi:sirohydrochlorin ferrochelatase
MRHPRLSRSGSAGAHPPLVAVAHGSRDPRAAAAVGDLLSLVRDRARARDLGDLDIRGAFLDHCAPTLRQALTAVAADGPAGGACVVVPLLLTAAYHSKTDIPAQIAAASADPGLVVRCADTLGPHPLLLAALERRLAEAGVADADRSSTGVVLAAAGSSDPAANATIAALAARWRRDGGWRAVVPAYASAASPSPAAAVMELRRAATPAHGGLLAPHPPPPVVVATYLLAPGYFADQIRREALDAGAGTVCDTLGAAPEVADVILDRYAAAARPAVGPAAAGAVAEAQLS